MSNYWKKFTENTSFGTTELCKYCDWHGLYSIQVQILASVEHRPLALENIKTLINLFGGEVYCPFMSRGQGAPIKNRRLSK